MDSSQEAKELRNQGDELGKVGDNKWMHGVEVFRELLTYLFRRKEALEGTGLTQHPDSPFRSNVIQGVVSSVGRKAGDSTGQACRTCKLTGIGKLVGRSGTRLCVHK